MNVNVLSKTRRLASITDFYCNKRVNILFRIKSFARRIRFHCTLHNQILYGNDNKLAEENKYKLLNDDVDYFKTTHFIIEDLVVKSSFLSNHDSILILDILSRIKDPLEKICSKTNVSYFSDNNNNNEHNNNNNIDDNIKYGSISGIISRGQKSLLKYLVKSEESMTLTNNERYYLIIALSRDCGLISFSTWMKLFENVYETLVNKPPDSLYGHKPYEIANLLLIFDQISRWSYKRQNNNNNNEYNNMNNNNNTNVNNKDNNKIDNILKDKQKDNNTSKQINKLEELDLIEKNDQLKELDNELELKRLERRIYNPFNLDIINIGISRLEKCLEQIKNGKIIKILYLANSRQSYYNNLFQNVLVHFELGGMLKTFELSEIYTLFNLFSRAYIYHLLRNIESLLYFNNLSIENMEIGVLKQLSGNNQVNLGGYNTFDLGKDSRINLINGIQDNMDNRDDEMYKLNSLESLCLCTIVISLEYLKRISKIDKDSLLEYVLITDRMYGIFGEDYEWKDILTFIENKIRNNENELVDKINITQIKEQENQIKTTNKTSQEHKTDITNLKNTTHQERNLRQVAEFIEKINTFRKINEFLLKIISNDKKYENRVERVRICMKLLDVIMVQATHSLSIGNHSSLLINKYNIAIEAINTSKIHVTTTTI